jgi:hypothetical protein
MANLAVIVFCSIAGLTQQIPPPAATAGIAEFPVTLQQHLIAGKVPVGTKVTAKLVVATLENGVVIPKNAVLTGEVLESKAKTATDPSRLAIRMDSAEWKNGSAPLKLYMTAWYYPTVAESGQDLQYGPQVPPNRTWNGQGQYPDPNSKVYRPFPSDDSDKKSPVPNTPNSVTSNHRVAMKEINAEHLSDGGIELVSKHANIKLDRYTTYVLAAPDLNIPK